MNLPFPTRVRDRVVCVTALMSVLLYLDRFCISFAEGFIKEDLGLTDVQIGWMLSAFFWTYALGQVPSGWLTDRFGPRLMLTAYIVLWSLLTGLTGAAYGFAVLLALRFGFGLAQAGAYPTGASIVKRWMPLSSRGKASSVVAVGGRIGGFLGLFASGQLIVWLTPTSTPATLDADDLRQPAKMCYEMVEAQQRVRASDAARLKVFQSLPPDAQRLVVQAAAGFKSAREGQGTSARVSGERQGPEILSAEETAELAGALNGIIARRAMFTGDDLGELQAGREVRGLLSERSDALSENQVQRLNRLILEMLFSDSIRKLYAAGWRPMMTLYGALGLLVAGLVWWTCRDHPREHPACNEAEVDLIEGPRRVSGGRPGNVSLVIVVRILCSRSMWLMSISQFFTNVGWVFLMTWAPRYFQTVHQVPIETRALMVSIPPLIGWFGTLFGGVLTDRLACRIGLRWGRALPIAMARLLPAFAYLGMLLNPSPWVAVAMFAAVSFFNDSASGSVWAFNQDVGGRYVGSVLGWVNMCGNLGAAVAPLVVIRVFEIQQSWALVFLVCAGAYLVAGLTALGANAREVLVPEES